METVKQYELILSDCSNAELFRLRDEFKSNYPQPMHNKDKLILQMIDDEIEMRDSENRFDLVELTQISRI